MPINFYLQAEWRTQKNGTRNLAVLEWYHFTTGKLVANGCGIIIDPGERRGYVDADIIKEHAKDYQVWRAEIDKNEERHFEAARADYLAKHGGLK